MATETSTSLPIVDWGFIPYKEAFDRQRELVDKILKGEEREQIIFCSHPPVVTLGRGTRDGDVFGWRGETVEVNRGGRATYHGPNQVIMYPLIYLGKPKVPFLPKKIPVNDLHAYMRVLELSVLDVLKHFGLEGRAQPPLRQVGENEDKEATGVWINEKKIAAIGIGVKGWVTSHGVALNIWQDPEAFQGIYPCGFRVDQVISMEDLLHRKVSREEIVNLWGITVRTYLWDSPLHDLNS
ncbi:MAG: lipoyl(octanoyl) transferase LipB [Bdellovibrionaceae bacterium]|nr:lipoyl(octanoyl) transferase LipB [Pseudobdellovibrionaceae bacterium]